MLACYLRLLRAGCRRYSTYRQAVVAVVLLWGNADFGERVRSGDVAVDLLGPVDLQAAACRGSGPGELRAGHLGYLLDAPAGGRAGDHSADRAGAALRIWMTASATVFWLVEGQELPNTVTYGSGMFTSYPVSVFSGWLLRMMAFVVPGAFVAYYPALAILGKPDPLGWPPGLQYSAQLVAVLTASVAALAWRAGLRHYVGTGS